MVKKPAKKSKPTKSPTNDIEVIPTYQPKSKVKLQGKIDSVEDNPDIQPDQRKRKIDVSEALKLRLVKFWSLQDIADKYGVSKQAVHEALQPFQVMITSPEAAQAYQENKANILSGIERRLAEAMLDEDKLKSASLNNVAYSFQAVHNANRLERNQSTANTSSWMHIINDTPV